MKNLYLYLAASLVLRKPVIGILTSSDTNQAIQPQKMARGVEWDLEGRQGLYYIYLYSDYEVVEQLRRYHAADLRLCFVHMQKADFFMTRLI